MKIDNKIKRLILEARIEELSNVPFDHRMLYSHLVDRMNDLNLELAEL